MIILSQDKRMIINFDNISGIVIRKNTDEDIFQLQCKSEGENKRIIGKYKTEERAKEVLSDLFDISMKENWECGFNGYKMPEN